MRWFRSGLWFVGSGVLFVLVFLLAAHLSGYYVRVLPRRGSPTATRLSFTPATAPALVQDFAAGTEVKNVIVLIGDGMGFSHLIAARAALGSVNERLLIERLPVTGWLTTHSATRIDTDSAAGATALATGAKTVPGKLSVSPEGEVLRSLVEAARAAGKTVGIVTDSYLWDATPAAFATHVEHRRDYLAVAQGMAESGIELLIGEQAEVPEGDETDDGAMVAGFVERGYRVARSLEDLGSAPRDAPLLGLFPVGALGDPARQPQLPQLADLALERLGESPRGFVLVVETEETDTGAHHGDFDRVVRGIASLDAVAAAAVELARRDRNTLVLATADHETGGMALLLGREGEPLTVRWATGNHTAEPVPLLAYGPGAEQLGGVRDNTEVPRILARLMGLEL